MNTNNTIQIKINGDFLELDNDTAIGFTFRGYRPEDPANIYLTYSNTFSIPKTPHNCRVFNFANSVHYAGNEVYTKKSGEIFLNGALLFRALINVSDITDKRINLYAIDKLDFFENLKKIPFADMGNLGNVQKYVAEYLQQNDVITGPTKQAAFNNWISSATGQTPINYFIGCSLGTMYEKHYVIKQKAGYIKYVANDFDGDNSLEDIDILRLYYNDTNNVLKPIKSPHIAINTSTIINVIFNNAGIDSNLGELLEEEETFLLCPDLIPHIYTIVDTPTSELWGCTVRYDNTSLYTADSEKTYMQGKTAYDFIKMLMQEYCLVLDVTYNVNTQKYVYTFNRLNDIETAERNKYELISIESKRFDIDNIKQVQTINYESLSNSEDINAGGLVIYCNNQNIEQGGTDSILFSINRHLFSYVGFKMDSVLYESTCANYTDVSIFDKFILCTPSEESSISDCTIYADKDTSISGVTVNGIKQNTIRDSGSYMQYQYLVNKPTCYTVKVKAKINDILNFRNFKTCVIDGLVGVFYISEIKSYNPITDNYLELKIYRIK